MVSKKAIEKSSLLAGSVEILSLEDVLCFIENKTVTVGDKVFYSDLTTEQLAGQYAYQLVDRDGEKDKYDVQIEFHLNFLSENIRIDFSKAKDHALTLLEEDDEEFSRY